MVAELRLFLNGLSGITSQVKSDHILNLFEEIDGCLPDDKAVMLAVIDRFLDLPKREQMLFQVGRRLGVLNRLDDLKEPHRVARVESFCTANGITPGNVAAVVEEIMQRFI